jgi:integrase
VLIIRDECDKNRFGRELPLCEGARAALDRVTPEIGSGLIFGRHDYRRALRTAAVATLSAEKAAKVSAYDFRHARLTWLCERSNNLVGVAYLSGHRRVDTLASRYVHPNRSAAVSVLKLTSKQLSFDDLLDLPEKGR